jgi:hypothetical protein
LSDGAAYRRFKESMVATYDRWHDGIGYDLDALKAMNDAERRSIEVELIADTTNWRDIEALAALGTETATAHIRKHLKHGPNELRLAAARALEHAGAGDEHDDAIVQALETAEPMQGLARALDMAARRKSPRVIDALFRATLRPDREAAVNAAGLLYFLFGKTQEEFDWAKRPFFLRFGEGAAEQRRAFAEMCAELGIDANKYLAP